DGAAVDRASVSIDGAPAGATSTGGKLRLDRLQPGRRTITISGDLFEDLTLSGVSVKSGMNAWTAKLKWVPGSVRVRARAPDGSATVLTGLAPGQVTLRVEAPGFEPVRADRFGGKKPTNPDRIVLIAGMQERRVVLRWLPRAVAIRVHAVEGSGAAGVPVVAA